MLYNMLYIFSTFMVIKVDHQWRKLIEFASDVEAQSVIRDRHWLGQRLH